jgi:hypothetical protein
LATFSAPLFTDSSISFLILLQSVSRGADRLFVALFSRVFA